MSACSDWAKTTNFTFYLKRSVYLYHCYLRKVIKKKALSSSAATPGMKTSIWSQSFVSRTKIKPVSMDKHVKDKTTHWSGPSSLLITTRLILEGAGWLGQDSYLHKHHSGWCMGSGSSLTPISELYISLQSWHFNPICIHMAIAGCWEPLSFDLPICMPLWLQQLYAWYHYLDVPRIFQSSSQSFAGFRGTGRTYWRMVQLSKHGQVMESNAHTYTRIGFIWTYWKMGEAGGKREN